jgi:hypothetical protein
VLVKRYLHLFRGAAPNAILPTWQYDWQDVFRYPWLEEIRQDSMP